MPSPQSKPFGSPAWFEQAADLLPNRTADPPSFIVEHRSTTPTGGMVVHQQLFGEDKLVGWIPGQATPSPDLTLMRSNDCDAGDLLGRLTATEIINTTSIIVAGHRQTCPLGITDIHRPGLEKVATRPVDFNLEVAATPFGDAELAICLTPDGTQHLIDISHADADLTLRLQWPTLLEWLHGDTRLGFMITRNEIHLEGPLLKLSYIEGHLSWPSPPDVRRHSHDFKRAMTIYQRLRHNPAYLDLMDQLDKAAQ